MSTKGFRVPADLAALPLTLVQVQRIIEIRGRIRLLETRIKGLPEKEKAMREEIEYWHGAEASILDGETTKDAE